LGLSIEEKILNYVNKKKNTISSVQNENFFEEKLRKSIKVNNIKIKIIDIFDLEKKLKLSLILCFLIYFSSQVIEIFNL